jgi:hypothetical protein
MPGPVFSTSITAVSVVTRCSTSALPGARREIVPRGQRLGRILQEVDKHFALIAGDRRGFSSSSHWNLNSIESCSVLEAIRSLMRAGLCGHQ